MINLARQLELLGLEIILSYLGWIEPLDTSGIPGQQSLPHPLLSLVELAMVGGSSCLINFPADPTPNLFLDPGPLDYLNAQSPESIDQQLQSSWWPQTDIKIAANVQPIVIHVKIVV